MSEASGSSGYFQDDESSSVWLVHASRKKDANKETLQRVALELAIDGMLGPVSVKVFHVMTAVSTPSKCNEGLFNALCHLYSFYTALCTQIKVSVEIVHHVISRGC